MQNNPNALLNAFIAQKAIFVHIPKTDTTLLDHLMDNRGNIFGDNGEISSITLFERGYHFSLKGGYFYPLIDNTKGLIALGGFGFMQFS